MTGLRGLSNRLASASHRNAPWLHSTRPRISRVRAWTILSTLYLAAFGWGVVLAVQILIAPWQRDYRWDAQRALGEIATTLSQTALLVLVVWLALS